MHPRVRPSREAALSSLDQHQNGQAWQEVPEQMVEVRVQEAGRDQPPGLSQVQRQRVAPSAAHGCFGCQGQTDAPPRCDRSSDHRRRNGERHPRYVHASGHVISGPTKSIDRAWSSGHFHAKLPPVIKIQMDNQRMKQSVAVIRVVSILAVAVAWGVEAPADLPNWRTGRGP